MRSSRKRSHDYDYDYDSSSSSSKINLDEKYHSRRPPIKGEANPHHQIPGKRLNFVSYTEVPSLSPKLQILCEILAKTTPFSLESYLEDTGIKVSELDVEEVLKLSYGIPGAAVKFFRWASRFGKHSPYAWNIVVDLLGKNGLFDAMWDATKSMKKENLLSLSTFSLVFSSYVIANRIEDAILSFEVIEEYGFPKDTMALNCLLRSICRQGKTREAKEYIGTLKGKIKLDSESYTILLEGWEKEGDVDRARHTFSEMTSEIGWERRNFLAYDAFLCALLKGHERTREVLKSFETIKDKGCFPGKRFLKLMIDECVRKSDTKCAKVIWDSMVGNNLCVPEEAMYKSLMSLYCNDRDFASAERLLDEMVYKGVFPDSETYNMLFHFMIKHRIFREAAPIFKEMVKNEFLPMQEDCHRAIKGYLHDRNVPMSIEVWRCMLENYSDLEETGNLLVLGLRDMNRVPEAVKCAEEMIERGIKVNSSTLSKLKQSLVDASKRGIYDELLSKWKAR